MIPVNHRRIFRSRWAALLWSAGILWFAADVANDARNDPATTAASNVGGTDESLDVAEFDRAAALSGGVAAR